MRVAMENHVDIFRRAIRRDVNEPAAEAVPFQVEREWPIEIGVAVSTHHRNGRPKCFDYVQDCRGANIAEMPDFISAICEWLETEAQFVVGIGEDENLHLLSRLGRSVGRGEANPASPPD